MLMRQARGERLFEFTSHKESTRHFSQEVLDVLLENTVVELEDNTSGNLSGILTHSLHTLTPHSTLHTPHSTLHTHNRLTF